MLKVLQDQGLLARCYPSSTSCCGCTQVAWCEDALSLARDDHAELWLGKKGVALCGRGHAKHWVRKAEGQPGRHPFSCSSGLGRGEQACWGRSSSRLFTLAEQSVVSDKGWTCSKSSSTVIVLHGTWRADVGFLQAFYLLVERS